MLEFINGFQFLILQVIGGNKESAEVILRSPNIFLHLKTETFQKMKFIEECFKSLTLDRFLQIPQLEFDHLSFVLLSTT